MHTVRLKCILKSKTFYLADGFQHKYVCNFSRICLKIYHPQTMDKHIIYVHKSTCINLINETKNW